MHVAILGGTGRIGPFLVRKLVEYGHEVTLMNIDPSPPSFAGPVKWIHLDRNDTRALAEAARVIGADALVDMFAGTYDETMSVVRAFRGKIGQLVNISAFDVYEAYVAIDMFSSWKVDPERVRALALEPMPISESRPLRTTELYPHPGIAAGFDKVLTERALADAAREWGFPSTNLRVGAIYGPATYRSEDPRVREWYFVKRALDRRPCVAISDQGLQILHRAYYENVAHAIVLCLENSRSIGMTYNVGDDKHLTLGQIAELVGEIVGHKWELVSVPRPKMPYWCLLDARHSYMLDLSDIQRDLGYVAPKNPIWALETTVKHLIENPPASDESTRNYEAEDHLIHSVMRDVRCV